MNIEQRIQHAYGWIHSKYPDIPASPLYQTTRINIRYRKHSYAIVFHDKYPDNRRSSFDYKTWIHIVTLMEFKMFITHLVNECPDPECRCNSLSLLETKTASNQ